MKQEESRLGNMDFAKLSEKLMRMDDEAWARHANPLSVWSRFSLLPLFALAVWSREWIGWWALVPVALVLLWNWVNPRLFGPPRSLDSWASKGVMGERLYLDRQTVRVREEHVRTARVLSAASALGAFILVYGLVVLNPWAAVCGVLFSGAMKAWFVDRMVWLYEDAERMAVTAAASSRSPR